MPLEIEVVQDLGGFEEPKWKQVGTIIKWKIDANFESPSF